MKTGRQTMLRSMLCGAALLAGALLAGAPAFAEDGELTAELLHIIS